MAVPVCRGITLSGRFCCAGAARPLQSGGGRGCPRLRAPADPWQGAGVGGGTSVTSIRRDRHLLVPTPHTSCPPPLLGRGAELLAEPSREGAGRFEAQQL